MLINGIEVNRDNLRDWSQTTLRGIQKTLAFNVCHGLGNVTEEKLLMKLISLEIKRKVKIENINLSAQKKSKWLIDNWNLIDRQTEPLHPFRSDRY